MSVYGEKDFKRTQKKYKLDPKIDSTLSDDIQASEHLFPIPVLTLLQSGKKSTSLWAIV